MKVWKLILWMLFLTIFFILLVASIGDVFEVVINNYARYLWFIMGGILVIFLNFLNKKNRDILMKSHNELTRMFLDFITFKEILRIKVDKHKGSVESTGNNIMEESVALAPYCLPLLAYVVMIFGYFFAKDMSYVFFILLGMAYTFHLLCIKFDFRSFKEMGRHLEDINRFPLIFSYFYILCFWLFNTMIVLVAIRSNVFGAFAFMFESFMQTVTNIF